VTFSAEERRVLQAADALADSDAEVEWHRRYAGCYSDAFIAGREACNAKRKAEAQERMAERRKERDQREHRRSRRLRWIDHAIYERILHGRGGKATLTEIDDGLRRMRVLKTPAEIQESIVRLEHAGAVRRINDDTVSI
jgi:Xaa-Pro aminopeptidase